MSNDPLAVAGVYEFVFGADVAQREELLKFWGYFGFEPVAEGTLDASAAAALYGHESALTSVRLAHPGCESFGTGYVRLQFWGELRNGGLKPAKPLDVGNRWMGMYTHDILSVYEVFQSMHKKQGQDWFMSPLLRAPFIFPEPEYDLEQPFMGLRELVMMAEDFRLAFVQRVGFDRPGFGTFDDSMPYKNTEGSHANIIQPIGSFSTDFYKEVFGLVTMAGGDAKDSGDDEVTIAALDLEPGQIFHIERLVHPDCPSGMLQVYAPHSHSVDKRDLARPGSRGPCLYTYRITDLDRFMSRAKEAGASNFTEIVADEFDVPALSFDSPDGIAWTVVAA